MLSKLRLAIHSIRGAITKKATVAAVVGALATGLVGVGVGLGVASHNSPSATAPTPTAPAQRGGGKLRGLANQLVRLVAQQTGQSTTAVRQGLASGKSLNEIAGSQAQAVVNAELAVLKQKLDQQVSAGKISSTQEAHRLQTDQNNVQHLMSDPGTQLLPMLGRSGSASTSPTP